MAGFLQLGIAPSSGALTHKAGAQGLLAWSGVKPERPECLPVHRNVVARSPFPGLISFARKLPLKAVPHFDRVILRETPYQ